VAATVAGRCVAVGHKIRGIGKAIRVTCGKKRIGDRNLPYAIAELHPGALYMHSGSTYRIQSLNMGRMAAEAVLMSEDIRSHTVALVEKTAHVKSVLDTRRFFETEVQYCDIGVTMRVNRYIERSYKARGGPAEDTPLERGIRHTFSTNATRFWAPRPTVAMRGGGGRGVEDGTYHAIEHVLIEASQMIIGVAHTDLDSKSNPSGEVYVYDGVDGGNGASRALHARMGEVVGRAIGILEGCGCGGDERGCMRCTFSHGCGKENSVLHKAGALESLRRLAGTFAG